MFEKISDRLKERAQKIKVIGFDVDGVLTDGSIYYNDEGEMFKKFSAFDGLGIRLADKFDLNTCIVSARNSTMIQTRFQRDLDMKEVHFGVHDKLAKVNEILERLGCTMDEFAFIGDDAVDVPVLEKAGLCACPPEAHYSIMKHIHYITERGAGRGCAREFVDLILYCQGKIPG